MKPGYIKADEDLINSLRPRVEAGRATVDEIIECAKAAWRLRLHRSNLGEWERDADGILTKGLRRFPDEPDLLRELADIRHLKRGEAGSRRLLRRARRLYELRGDWDRAESAAEELAHDAFFDGCEALDGEDFSEAEKCFRTAIRVFPFHADAWGHLGIIHERRGNLVEAARCYWRGVQLGRITCHERDMQELWIAKVTRSRGKPRAHYWGHLETRAFLRGLYNWAQLLYQRKHFRRALTYAEESLLANPSDNTGARYLLYSILRILGKASDMRRLARQNPGESLSAEADALEIRCFGAPIGKPKRRNRPN